MNSFKPEKLKKSKSWRPFWIYQLEPVYCKEQQKKSPNQETGLGHRGPLEAMILND